MTDTRQAFLKLLETSGLSKLRFTVHSEIRQEQRRISKEEIAQFLFHRQEDLVSVVEDVGKDDCPRYKAFYNRSKKKAFMIVIDVEAEGFLNIVTVIIMDKKEQLEAIRNAARRAKLASRLR